jgi:hypothetical protein
MHERTIRISYPDMFCHMHLMTFDFAMTLGKAPLLTQTAPPLWRLVVTFDLTVWDTTTI